jgi:hypothetical protein
MSEHTTERLCDRFTVGYSPERGVTVHDTVTKSMREFRGDASRVLQTNICDDARAEGESGDHQGSPRVLCGRTDGACTLIERAVRN